MSERFKESAEASADRSPWSPLFFWLLIGRPAATGADFSFASSDFKTSGAFFCNFLQLCHSCGVAHGQPARPSTTSCGFAASGTIPFPSANSIFSTCCGAISGRLRFCSLGPLAPRFRRPKRLCSKTDDRPGDLRRDDAVRTNIEQLRNSGKKFVERHDQGHGMLLIASIAASRSSREVERRGYEYAICLSPK